MQFEGGAFGGALPGALAGGLAGAFAGGLAGGEERRGAVSLMAERYGAISLP